MFPWGDVDHVSSVAAGQTTRHNHQRVHLHLNQNIVREAAKKNFFFNVRKKVHVATKPGGGG